MSAAPLSFDEATAVRASASGAPGEFDAELDLGWFGTENPHGGIVSALMLRAMSAMVGHTGFSPQSFNASFMRAPRAGAVQITAALERTGRRIATATALMHQAGRLCIRASAAFAAFPAGNPEWESPAPQVPSMSDTPRVDRHGLIPAFSAHLDQRPAVGAPAFSGGDPITGGWMQTHTPHPIDGAFVVFLADAWLPSAFVRLRGLATVPTIDFTVHFLCALREPLAAEPVLIRLAAPAAYGGTSIEDGELWSAAGRLIAVSRQSSLLVDA